MPRTNITAALAGIAVIAALLLSSCSQTVTGSNAVALVNCMLIDGTGVLPVKDAAVIIENGKITSAGPKSAATIPAGARIVDLKGATLLPGFINAHVHRAYDEQTLQSWLAAGVTTVRDEAPMIGGDFLAKRDELNKKAANATIVSATPILTVPGGYGTPSFTSAQEAKKKAEEYITRGADIIKFSIEDDLQGRTWAMPTADEVKALVDAAHAGKHRASVHISHTRNLQWAIDAGVDDIAHMVVEPFSNETVSQIVLKGIYWEPTLELWQGVSTMHSLNWIDICINNLSIFYKAGGKVALGTDFAGYTTSFDKGFPITEARLMKQAGMTNMDIIVAGTKNAAYVCSLDGVTGTVEAGRDADLLIVTGDPLSDLDALLNVQMVVHKGQIIVDNISK